MADVLSVRVVCLQPPAGWLLLRGTVRNDGAGVYAWLHMDLGSGVCSDAVLPIPITCKGTILELIRVPEECSGLFWNLEGDVAAGDVPSLLIEPVAAPERIWRMVRRVLPMFYKHARRKRLRAGLTVGKFLADLPGAYAIAGRFRSYVPQMTYPDWLAAFDRLTRRDLQCIRHHISCFTSAPSVTVLISVRYDAIDGLSRTLSSLADQLYPASKIVLLLDDTLSVVPVRSVIAAFPLLACQLLGTYDLAALHDYSSEEEWLLAHILCGDVLPPHALYWVVAEYTTHPQIRIIYSDDDSVIDGERVAPRFKPDWSLELLRSVDYIGPFFAFSSLLFSRLKIPGTTFAMPLGYGFLLRLVDSLQRGEGVYHIPALLCQRHTMQEKQTYEEIQELQAHLDRRGVNAVISKTVPGVVRVKYVLPRCPLVSIIIPTRDGLTMLRRCLDSIFQKSSYRNIEIILIDNRSELPETRAYFASLAARDDVRVLSYDAPFNYSAMNNLGVTEAGGEAICLLNNDTEVISPDWLEEMLGHLQQHGVGVVGAKLFYPDGRVQHGGDTVGPGGCAHHLHSFLEQDDSGYCQRAVAAQDLSAVTAACLLTWKSLYESLGGLDEHNLKIAFNDVDYCLRVREAGQRVVWTPHARLYHHESASRGKNDTLEKVRRSKAEADYIRKKWRHLMEYDPYYNVNCSYEHPDFSLSNAPGVLRPWER